MPIDDLNDGDILDQDGWDSIIQGVIAARKAFNSNVASSANIPFVIPFNVSSGTVTLPRGVPHYFTEFTLDGTATLIPDSVGANDGLPLIIYVDGDVTIGDTATIDLDGDGHVGGAGGGSSSTAPGAPGGGQSLAAFATAAVGGGAGGAGNNLGAGGGGGGAGGGAAGTNGVNGSGGAGGAGGTFAAWPVAEQPDDLRHIWNVFVGAGAGGGGSGNQSGAGGNGGAGGGGLIIVCSGDLTFEAGATISADGVNGGAGSGTQDAGGGGGGGGGTIMLLCDGTLDNSGTITTTGGAGGLATTSGGGDGGAGGTGITFANTY